MEKFIIRSLGRIVSQLRPHLLLGPVNYICLSNRFDNSCRCLPETKRHSSLLLH